MSLWVGYRLNPQVRRTQHCHVIGFNPFVAVQKHLAKVILKTVSQLVLLPDKHLALPLPYSRQSDVDATGTDVEALICQLPVNLNIGQVLLVGRAKQPILPSLFF